MRLHLATTVASLSLMSALAACVAAPVGEVGAHAERDLMLCDEISVYRAEHGQDPIPTSTALMTVARYHAEDLAANGTGGESCNLHSWTRDDPRWTGCCYTDDHSQAPCMWSKPHELTSYSAPGVEIAARVGTSITPERAVAAWHASESHRIVMANDSDFADATWRAMGCALESGYAIVWFGELAWP